VPTTARKVVVYETVYDIPGPRCLVPVDKLYEWTKTAAGKRPYAVALADRGRWLWPGCHDA
jgi:putative SOS response-associated peptidase YedK